MARIFWATAWLGLGLVAVKASYVLVARFWAWASPGDYLSWDYLRWLTAASAADIRFSLALGAVGALVALALARLPRSSRAVAIGLLACGATALAYAVVSRQVYAYYGAPLTYQLLSLGGEPTKLLSSVEAYVTTASMTALVGLPVAYVLLVAASGRLEARWRPRTRLLVRLSFASVLVGSLVLGRSLLGSDWFKAQDRRIPESAHATLLQSALLALPGVGSRYDSLEIGPEDLREFTAPVATDHHDGSPRARAWASHRRPRNVVLVVLESVGARYLGIYGSGLDTTPRIGAELGNALVFDRYYAPVAWTAYSLISLVSAQRPPMERYRENEFHAVGKEGQSLAVALRSRGYRTAFMAAGDPDWASAGFLERNGFEEVRRGDQLPGARALSSWGTEDRHLFDAMLDWIGERGKEPFFLMAWTDQTHHPYRIGPDQLLADVFPADAAGSESDLGRYLRLVREADTQIGRLLDGLRRRGLARDTLVVVTGDHGEGFGELHGHSGHGFSVYDEEVRVPLVMWNPGLFRHAGRSTVAGSHIDLAPTILDVLGIPAMPDSEGASLFDGSRSPRVYLFAAAWGQYLLGVRDEDVKYVYDAREGREELYDLSRDPDEQRNIVAAEPDRARQLRRRLVAWLRVQRAGSLTASR